MKNALLSSSYGDSTRLVEQERVIAKMDLNCSKLTILLKLDKNGNYTKIASEINLPCTCLKSRSEIFPNKTFSAPVETEIGKASQNIKRKLLP